MTTTRKIINELHEISDGKFTIRYTINYDKETISLLSSACTHSSTKSPHSFVFEQSYPETVRAISDLFNAAAQHAQYKINDYIKDKGDL